MKKVNNGKNLSRILILILAMEIVFGSGANRKVISFTPLACAGSAANSDQAVQQKVLSFNLEGLTDKGEKKWEINGESAESISETEVKLDNIVAKSYGEDVEATITADKGVYDKAKNNVRLEENVKATIDNTAESIGSFITLPGQDQTAEGVKKKKTTTIVTCEADVIFDYEGGKAYFNKNVIVDSDDGRITADRITINLDTATKKVKDIVAEGNVKIKRGENTTYSERAVYDTESKKVILTGRPKLVIYQEGNGGLASQFSEKK